MMASQMIAGLAVFVRCSCPTLVLLRWDVEMPGLNFDVVVVVDDSTNHAKCDAAIFSLVEDLDDAVICLDDVVVLFLYDAVVVLVLLRWFPRMAADSTSEWKTDDGLL